MLQRNGHYANGKQRYFCPSCKHSVGWRNSSARLTREREWFRRWISEGYSVRQLCQQSGHSPAKLYRIINRCLDQMAPEALGGLDHGRHLILDGTFIHRPRSIIALMDGQTHMLMAGQYGVSESSESELGEFMESLKEKGLRPSSFTVDGNPNVMRMINKLWPGMAVQRCLVHIQRQGLSWCRTSPRTPYARRLRKIFSKVTSIRTLADRDHFLRLVIDWESRYGAELSTRPATGYVFSDIKHARSMLIRALPDMFHYLDDPLIPTSTNGLEGYFSRLKNHYRQHRGLSPRKHNNYFGWYFHMVPK